MLCRRLLFSKLHDVELFFVAVVIVASGHGCKRLRGRSRRALLWVVSGTCRVLFVVAAVVWYHRRLPPR